MKDNTIVLLVGEVVLGFLTGCAMVVGENQIAGVGVGAFVGLLAGHLNGTGTSNPTIPEKPNG